MWVKVSFLCPGEDVELTFTFSEDLLYNIDTLAEFYIGWAQYRGIYSIWTNTITLNEAPPIWAIVSVDYFKI